MKPRLLFFALMLLHVCLVDAMTAKYCIVAGSSNQPLSAVVLENSYGSQTTNSDSSGRFHFSITINSPQYFQLTTDKTIHVFLIPGDSIFVDTGNLPNVRPANGSAVISNYLIDWYAATDSMTAGFDIKAFYSKDAASFITAVTTMKDLLSAPLQRLVAHTPRVNKEFVRLEQARLNFWVWCPLNRYEYRYELYTGAKAEPPADFYEYLCQANFNDPSFLQMSDFDDFTDTFLEMKLFKASQQDPHAYEDRYFTTKVLLDVIRGTFTDRRVRDKILYKKMWEQIYYMDVNDSLFAVVRNTLKDPKHIGRLRTLYTSLQKFQAGHIAPEFSLMDARDSLYTLGDFRGRYVLIDVWGIYCNPCLRELPALKQIKAEFRDANLAFIAVNLDGTKEAWTAKIRELGLDGLQLMAPKGWDSAFRKTYGIDQVPTFILIDREGRFIDSRTNLPSKGLKDVLNGLPSIRTHLASPGR